MSDPVETPGADGALPPRRTGPQPVWMTSGGQAPVGRGKALFVGLLLIVALAGVLLGILLLPTAPVNAYLVSVHFSLYEDTSLPPVAFAEQDTKLLVDCLPKNSENAFTAGELEPLRNKLKAIAEGKIRLEPGESNAKTLEEGQPFIFHLVGHAAIANDAVHLLPLKANTDDPKTWLPLADVLKALADCPTKKKLLLLDLGRPRLNAFLGPLHDDVTPKLHEWLSKQRSELPCPVIVSCSPGEESLVIPQAGASSFAFYLAEGLRGAADGYGTPAPDRKVKVRELAEFVRVRVARWARQNRDVPQLTKLFEPPEFQDFDLMLDVPPPIIEDPELQNLPFAKIGMTEGWASLAELPAASARRAGPQLARWSASAIRAEQIYAANPADTRTADAVRNANLWWEEVRNAGRTPDLLAYRTLANVAIPTPPRPTTPPTPDPAIVFRMALDRYARAALPDGGTKIDDKELTDRKGEFEAAASNLTPAVAAKLIWIWMTERYAENAQPKSREIAFVASLLKGVLKNETELFVEPIALIRIATLELPPFERPEARATLWKFVRVQAAAGQSLRHGSVGFAWVASDLNQADEANLATEQSLWAAVSRADVEKVDRALDDLLQKYQNIDDRFATFAAARDALDDGIRVLVGTALSHAEFDWPLSTERDAATFQDWNNLAIQTKRLADELDRRPPANWETRNLKRLTRDILELTAKLLKEVEPAAIKRFVDGATSARPADLRRYRAALLTAILAGTDRAKVWDAAEAIATRLHLATRKDADLLDNEARTVTKPPTLPAPLTDGRSRRAEVSVRLIELANHPAGTKLRTMLDDLRRAESPDKWIAFTKELRQVWNRNAYMKLLASIPANEPEAMERLARVIPPGLWQDAPDKPAVGDWRDAIARRRREDEILWRNWLAAHYRKYATARTDVPNAAERYQKAAQDADRKPQV